MNIFKKRTEIKPVTQEGKILEAIRRSGYKGIENWQLSRIALNYTAVISELRKDGHNITAIRQTLPNGRPSGTYKYVINEDNE